VLPDGGRPVTVASREALRGLRLLFGKARDLRCLRKRRSLVERVRPRTARRRRQHGREGWQEFPGTTGVEALHVGLASAPELGQKQSTGGKRGGDKEHAHVDKSPGQARGAAGGDGDASKSLNVCMEPDPLTAGPF
jgi:hypothetical protein